MPLLELIVKSGIADAIDSRFGDLKGNKEAIAESIENNVRSKIIKEHLSDPAFYDKMSTLLDEIIAARKAKAIEYEKYLKLIAELVKKVEAGHADDMPAQLNTPGKRALYNLLSQGGGQPGIAQTLPSYEAAAKDGALEMAIQIDEAVKQKRPDGWRGVQAREQVIKGALFDVLKNVADVERIFLIIRQQKEY